jgi:hypothetical protein
VHFRCTPGRTRCGLATADVALAGDAMRVRERDDDGPGGPSCLLTLRRRSFTKRRPLPLPPPSPSPPFLRPLLEVQQSRVSLSIPQKRFEWPRIAAAHLLGLSDPGVRSEEGKEGRRSESGEPGGEEHRDSASRESRQSHTRKKARTGRAALHFFCNTRSSPRFANLHTVQYSTQFSGPQLHVPGRLANNSGVR